MVPYELVSHMGDVMLYAYWSDDNRLRAPGIVRVDLLEKEVTLVEAAEGDRMLCTVRYSTGVRELWKYFEDVRRTLRTSLFSPDARRAIP